MYATNTALPAWVCFAVAITGLLFILLVVFVVRRASSTTDTFPTGMQLPIETESIRAEPLPYRNPLDERRRPGILTAVAVISIVVGCFGLLANLLDLLS